MSKVKVLIIEDELSIRKFIIAGLDKQMYQVLEATKGEEGIRLLAMHSPDLLLLDLGLPDIDGLKVITEIRTWSKIPIIVISARGKEEDKILALDAGADDYLTKPFSVSELQARIRALLRRLKKDEKDSPTVFEFGDLKIEFPSRQVFLGSELIHLTPKEYNLLKLLVDNQGCVITHKQLLLSVWGQAYLAQPHYVRVFMKNIRHKLKEDPTKPKYIITEPGVGYRFIATVSTPSSL